MTWSVFRCFPITRSSDHQITRCSGYGFFPVVSVGREEPIGKFEQIREVAGSLVRTLAIAVLLRVWERDYRLMIIVQHLPGPYVPLPGISVSSDVTGTSEL